MLGWAVALGSYLVYFVAVKSIQYLIPLFLPLYGGVFGFSEAALAGLLAKPQDPVGDHDMGRAPSSTEVPPFTRLLADLVPAGFMLAQVGINLVKAGGDGVEEVNWIKELVK